MNLEPGYYWIRLSWESDWCIGLLIKRSGNPIWEVAGYWEYYTQKDIAEFDPTPIKRQQ